MIATFSIWVLNMNTSKTQGSSQSSLPLGGSQDTTRRAFDNLSRSPINKSAPAKMAFIYFSLPNPALSPISEKIKDDIKSHP